ncbi:MAG: hypothetical protein D6680_07225 [Cyanobacteria bacterium J007]|nr:MAG: hypothetical protein D6680_07225 [Cyanobacteria bacterium J007]
MSRRLAFSNLVIRGFANCQFVAIARCQPLQKYPAKIDPANIARVRGNKMPDRDRPVKVTTSQQR